MNRDDVLRMADEAGITFISQVGVSSATAEWLESFAALVAAAEREGCARVCDFEVARLTAIDEPRPALAVGICAAAIRARGES